MSPYRLTYQQSLARRSGAAFDGGRITTDCGAMLLAQAERRLDIADLLAC
jgi:hypothetical protein